MAFRISLSTAYVVITGVVGIGIVFIFFVLQPMYSSIEDTREEILKQNELLRERMAFLRSVDLKINQLRLHQDHEEQLAIMLPTSERIEDALRILHQSAVDTGVVIRGVDNQTQTVRSKVNAQRARGETVNIPDLVDPVGVSMSVVGTYQQIRAYLNALERSPRIMDVTQIRLVRGEQVAAAEQIEASLSVQFYMQRVPEYMTAQEQ